LRASFELKILAANITEARIEAYKHIASFIECEPSEVPDKADVEVKIKTIDIGDDPKRPLWSESTEMYEVTVFGTVKHSIVRPY
jgi:hypothetical protein